MTSKERQATEKPSFSFMVVDDSKFACRNMLRPDLVLMDITMPEMQGIEAVEGILAEDSSAKVVMVNATGYKES